MGDQEQGRLESWKEIGAYLQRDVRTAHRWEKEEGLPVHRHSHKARASVYAYPSEIDAWRASRKVVPEPEPPRPLWKMPAFALTMALCLVMVGNGLRPQPASAQGAGPVARQVWTGPEVNPEGQVSLDGRYLTFTNWDTGDLGLRDLRTRSNRLLTDNVGATGYYESSEISVISPDNRQVVYQHFDGKAMRYRLRLVSMQGSKPRNVMRDQEKEPYIEPLGWTPDGKQVLTVQVGDDQIWQIGLVSIAEGTTQVVKSLKWGKVHARISPDGKFIAYDSLVDGKSEQRDIFILATDGSREAAVVQHSANDYGAVWSPDGSKLLFLSQRTGKPALWSVPIQDGKAAGAAELVREGFEGGLLGIGRDGVLYYHVSGRDRQNVFRTELDSNGRVSKPPVIATDGFVNSNRGGDISPDGQSIAYYSYRPEPVLVVRNLSSGEERVVATKIKMLIVSPYLQGPEWFPDGQHVLVIARSNNRPGNIFYRVNVRTGEAEEVLPGSGSGTGGVYDVSPAAGTVFARGGGNLNLLSIDVATGRTMTLVTSKAPITALASSPDGKRIAYLSWVDAARAGTGSEGAGSHLWVMPTTGGTPKEIFHDVNWGGASRFNTLEWTPDGRYLLFVRGEKQMNTLWSTLWRIPVEGGEAEDLGLTMKARIKSPFVHPDGKTMYFTAVDTDDNEVWALENFLPPASSGK